MEITKLGDVDCQLPGECQGFGCHMLSPLHGFALDLVTVYVAPFPSTIVPHLKKSYELSMVFHVRVDLLYT